MKKLIAGIVAGLVLTLPLTANAASISDFPADKAAHFGVSYVICDQLERNCGFNKFWAGFTTLAIGAAKEKFIDDHWDGGDFAADCAGVLFYQIKW
jgi:hypothetical protein